jgi:hypothetical protein
MNVFERLKQIENNYRVARLALTRLEAETGRDSMNATRAGLRSRDVGRCLQELEPTFVVRLFAEFEATTRHFWRGIQPAATHRPRTIKWILARLAARFKVGCTVLDRANDVRRYRNYLVHQEATPQERLSIENCRSFLNRFASHLGRDFEAI